MNVPPDPARAAGGDGFDAARAAARDGDAMQAMALIREQLRAQERPPPADVLVPIGEITGAEQLADAARRVAAAPNDLQALFDLGTQLSAVGVPDVAVPLLRELLDLVPGNRHVLAELAAALEESGRHREAAAVLRDHREQLAGDFTAMYLLAFHSILSGDLGTAGDVFEHLPSPADAQQAGMRGRLAGMLARAGALDGPSTLDDRDLRGWHFVITGGVLTGRAAAGMDEGMNGRWAMVFDGYDAVHESIRRVKAVLDSWGVRPPAILALPDRGSHAVGRAAARLFGVALDPWTSQTGDPGLVVAYDLAEAGAETLSGLARHRPSQPLYAHAASWTNPPRVAPDFVAVLYQHLVPPWGQRMRMTEAADGQRHVEQIPPDDAPADVLAEHILAADPQTAPMMQVESAADVVAFAEPLYDLAAATQDTGYREPFWAGSPVPSNRFT